MLVVDEHDGYTDIHTLHCTRRCISIGSVHVSGSKLHISFKTPFGGAKALQKFTMGEYKRRVAALLAARQCYHCEYEAFEGSRKRKTFDQLAQQRDRKHRLERARELCACSSCAPGGTRESLITSEGCLCKNTQDRRAQETIRLNCVHRLCADPDWSCKAQKYNYREYTPAPPTESMLKLQQLLMSIPPAHRSQMRTQRSRSRSRSQMRDNRSRGATDVSVASSSTDNPAVAIQKDWATVKAILTTQVLNLERTRSEVQWALADCSTTIRLTDKKDVTQHVFEVVKTLPADMRFKVGITNELQNRFYDSSYAYSMPNTHAKDGIVYEGWILVYIDNQRRVVAMLEHNLIKMFTELEIPGIINHKPRCANRLKIFDDRMECDQSDEEEERSDSRGPHWVYIAWGKWCPAFRP